MKRQGQTLNARQVRAGRNLLRWGAAGMNWAPGEPRDALIGQSKALMGRGAAFAAAFAVAAQKAAGEDGYLTQTYVSAVISAAAVGQDAAEKMAVDWEAEAAEREASRHWNDGWTYDAQTESCLRIAEAIRFAGRLQWAAATP